METHPRRSECSRRCISRRIRSKSTSASEIWTRVLSRPEDEWPQTVPTTADKKEVNKERRKTPAVCTVTTTQEVISCTKFSSWRKLIRVTARIHKLGAKIRRKREGVKATAETDKDGTLTPDELNKAKVYWIKQAQKDLHSRVKNGDLKQFRPFVDLEGIIRVGGRLSKAMMTYDCKHPALLPYKHWVSLLITRHMHCFNWHCFNHREGPKKVLDSTSTESGEEGKAIVYILQKNTTQARITTDGRSTEATIGTANTTILLCVL